METDKIKKGERLDRWATDKYRICMHRIDHHETYNNMQIVQGAIYTCEFGENIGYEQGRPRLGNRRPALVISNNISNSSISTVIVLPLTTTLKYYIDGGIKKPKVRTHYFLFKRDYPFLQADSAVKVECIREVDKVRLDALMGIISDTDLHRIIKKLEWLTKRI